MATKDYRPAWWQVPLLALGILGLLVWGALAHLSERGHEAAAIGVVVLAWVLVEAWLRANRGALLHVEGLHLVELPAPDAAPAQESGEAAPALFAGSAEPQAAALLPVAEAARKEGVAR